ncbi:capsule assembly protein Wzi [Pedobacter metabolipauper]|uniref:Capsule assembly protein Wzi n=1 Tax=Pedobacter metabolipauper TaxID=425513 RepID=A0A4R6SWZ5_9SPHI|nr:capsule assembly protein Wzi [Pedobacter metabolipauper]
MVKTGIVIFLILLLNTTNGFAQTLPVGILENVEDAYRRQQLLGNDSSRSSYMIRPLFMSDRNDLLLDQAASLSLSSFRTKIYENKKLATEIYLLPFTTQQQYNSHHPYGINDGSMVSAKGYQNQFSGGAYAKIGPLSIQLRPEYVYAYNADFREMHEVDPDPYSRFTSFYNVYYNNYIDQPERMGQNHSYNRLSWGQSSIRLTLDPVSVGLSNENLWWGPGVRNSLLMSNNAPGFKHLTLNTTRPINSPIGAFEAQVIAGRLDPSGVKAANTFLFVPKNDDWRYISGVIITYQPKIIPNLFLGFSRVFVLESENLGKSFGDYFPFFSALEKSALADPNDPNAVSPEDAKERDQLLSAYARWVLPETHAEMYFEIGRNDHSFDLRDGLVEPEQSLAYTIGFRKLITMKKSDEFIQIGAEMTQLEGPRSKISRAQPPWYIHGQVHAGYTQRGQILGAGIGSGSNLQSLDISWVKGLKRIGLQLERLANNNDLFESLTIAYAGDTQYIKRRWIDLSLTGKFAWNWNKIILNGEATYIRSDNYQYQLQAFPKTQDRGEFVQNNIHVKMGLMYNF